MAKSRTFGVTFSNVPIVNLRLEFRDFYRCAHSPGFFRQPDGEIPSLHTRYFIWIGMPNAGATTMLARSILGIEAYTCFAARFGGAERGNFSDKLKSACDNPFSLGGGAADNYFNRLPALVGPDVPMKVMNPELWKNTLAFYREIRNPMFHGEELSSVTADQLAQLFDLLASIYGWLDTWFESEPAVRGAKGSFRLDRREVT